MTRRQLLVLVLLTLLVCLLAICTARRVEGAEIVDCDEGRCVQIPVDEAARLAADLVTARRQLAVCQEGLSDCREMAKEYDPWEPLDCPPVIECEECAWEWWEWVIPVAAAIVIETVLVIVIAEAL